MKSILLTLNTGNMKKIIFAIIILYTGFPGVTDAQVLINQGSDIFVTAGSSIVIDGDFENQLDGSMNLAGDILITGDWVNNATSGNLLIGTSGTVNFVGSATQYIGGSNFTYFNSVNLQNDVNLAYTASISGDLTHSNTFLTLGSYTLVMQFGSQIVGANSSGYIIADGTGRLLRYVDASNTEFPIGTISAFVPLTLSNTGTTDYYAAHVFPDVRVNGLTGATIPEINDCVNMTWDITENVSGGSNLSVTTYWGAGIEGPTFDRLNCGMGHYTGGAWDPQTSMGASGSNPYSITRTGITSLSAFAVGDVNSPMAITLDMSMDITALLEGPFNGSDMDDDLRLGGYIPLAQPYNVAPWLYMGSENVPAIPPNVIDWVLIQLRDAPNAGSATPGTAIATRAAFVLNDGSIVDLDGSSNLQFNAVINDDLFVVLWHRNHLGIISANPLTDAGGGVYPYNFTTAGQALGPDGQKQIAAGVYGMFGGDGDANGFIQLNDKTGVWAPNAGTEGYKSADFNLDGQTNNQDKDDSWSENVGDSSKVPN